jgi:hypothetical protein
MFVHVECHRAQNSVILDGAYPFYSPGERHSCPRQKLFFEICPICSPGYQITVIGCRWDSPDGYLVIEPDFDTPLWENEI